MGVPNFYTWLVNRYPLCLYEFKQGHSHNTDFFYLDMNQIIYKCATSPGVLFRDQVAEKKFNDVWVTIINYIDRIINLVSPKKLLFLTFDGVAPRAKMNQQRQRRFQSAQRAQRIDEILQSIGEIGRNETFKNNQITAGTEFMQSMQNIQIIENLPSNTQVRFYIQRKIHEDTKWKDLKVIFSGSDVPGEGEHKILEFIRNLQKDKQKFDENWTHMIYGADADLIMLGLITQIKYISIVREIMTPMEIVSSATQRQSQVVDFQLINLNIVREYMELEFKKQLNEEVPFDIHRLIDDFILICFFIGNDFLPRIYCFDIRVGTFEDLIQLFKQHLSECQGYLSLRGKMNWKEFTRFVKRLTTFEILALQSRKAEINEYLIDIKKADKQYKDSELLILKELSLIEKLSKYYKDEELIQARSYFYSSKCEFDVEKEDGIIKLQQLDYKYIEGIQFVLFYYFSGIPSWNWYYPAYYAPLCSDLFLYLSHMLSEGTEEELYQFELGQPFKPFKQLLCILSPGNAILLPQPYRHLLTDMQSPLRSPYDFYPSEFTLDPYGTIWEHQFIAKIPFLQEEIINKAYLSISEQMLSENDKVRNIVGVSYLIYKDESNPIKVISTIPEIFHDFQTNQVVEHFDIDDDNQYMKLRELLKFSMEGLNCEVILYYLQDIPKFQIPSLRINLKESSLVAINDPQRRSHKLTIKHNSDTQTFVKLVLESKLQKKSKLSFSFSKGLFAYCGYPIPKYAEVLGLMNQQMITLCYNYKKRITVHIIISEYSKTSDKVYMLFNQILKLFTRKSKEKVQIVRLKISYSSDIINNFYVVVMSKKHAFETQILLEWAFPTQTIFLNDIDMQCHFNIIQRKMINPIVYSDDHLAIIMDNQDKSLIGSQVKILEGPQNGKGDYKVALIHTPSLKKQSKVKQVQTVTYSLNFVADECLSMPSVLLYILGKVIISLDKNFDSQRDLVPTIDIGLNVIDRQKNLLVPELVRIHKADQLAQGSEKYIQFKYLELTYECFQQIIQYRKKCPHLFWVLERMAYKDFNLRNVSPICSSDIFPRAKDPNIALMELYLWLSKQSFSQFSFSSAASSVVQASKIKEFIKQAPKQYQVEEINQPVPKILQINPGVLLVDSSSYFVPPFFREHPQLHKLGDRVVSLNSVDFGMPSFGSYGTVVGILDAGDEIIVEVVWDKPQIGLTSLGQRCPMLRGTSCKFVDVYNLTQDWSRLLSPITDVQINGWDFETDIYTPDFEQAPINNSLTDKKVQDPLFQELKEVNEILKVEKKQYYKALEEGFQEQKQIQSNNVVDMNLQQNQNTQPKRQRENFNNENQQQFYVEKTTNQKASYKESQSQFANQGLTIEEAEKLILQKVQAHDLSTLPQKIRVITNNRERKETTIQLDELFSVNNTQSQQIILQQEVLSEGDPSSKVLVSFTVEQVEQQLLQQQILNGSQKQDEKNSLRQSNQNQENSKQDQIKPKKVLVKDKTKQAQG